MNGEHLERVERWRLSLRERGRICRGGDNRGGCLEGKWWKWGRELKSVPCACAAFLLIYSERWKVKFSILTRKSNVIKICWSIRSEGQGKGFVDIKEGNTIEGLLKWTNEDGLGYHMNHSCLVAQLMGLLVVMCSAANDGYTPKLLVLHQADERPRGPPLKEILLISHPLGACQGPWKWPWFSNYSFRQYRYIIVRWMRAESS